MSVNSIVTNLAAFSAQRNIGIASQAATASVSRLSSGNRIVQSSDDVAALSIGTSLASNVGTLRVALINASQGSSLLQVADGGLSQITEVLQRQKAIAVQAGSGSLSDTERAFLNQEFQSLSAEIDRLAGTATNFNGVNLLDGSLAGANPLQSAANGGGTITGFTAQTLITAVAFADNGTGTLGDTTFYGDLSTGSFTVERTAANNFAVTYTINGSTYVGNVADLTATGTSLALTNGEGTITFTIAGDITPTYADSTAGAALFETALTNSFQAAKGFADRTFLATNATVNGTEIEGSAIEAEDTNGTLLQGMTGADFQLVSQFYNGGQLPTISDFTAVGTFGVGTSFSVTIEGRTYTTGALADATDLSGNGGAGAIITGIANNTLRFYLDGDATTNPNEYLDINLTNSVQDIDVDTQEGVNLLLADLNSVTGRSGGGLSFQVGSNSNDTVSVAIAAANTNTIYKGATLNVATQIGATTAAAAIDVALDTITGIRADVGALQSRFNFASTSIEISIQNQDAARSALLDTDVASESTAFATSQVQLQAGISTLAQANQLQQALLKLIG